MELNEYQTESRKTAVYPDINSNIVYPTLGLAGEAGEVANKVKKIIRDKGGLLTGQDRKKIADELGDVLWYVGALASELGYDLDLIAVRNLIKLRSRQEQNKLHGTGDSR
jgi:NTP pyrophosphatase (non-canonical NTP hydrolase)